MKYKSTKHVPVRNSYTKPSGDNSPVLYVIVVVVIGTQLVCLPANLIIMSLIITAHVVQVQFISTACRYQLVTIYKIGV